MRLVHVIAGLMMLVSLLGLTGCQVPQPQPSTVTITFADFESNYPLYERRIAGFHDQTPNVLVQFAPLDQIATGVNTDYRLLASFADTVALPTLPQGVDANYFLNLDPFIESDSAFEAEAFWPGLLDGCRVDGRKVGLPTSVQVSLIFFNKTAFDAAGLPHPTPSWTWDDFQKTARSLTQRSGNQVPRYGFVDGGRPLSVLAPLVSATVAKPGTTLDPNRLAQALSWYVDLAHEGVIPVFGKGADTVASSESLVYTGQAAMWIGLLSDLPELRASLQDEIGVAPFPVAADGSVTNTTPAVASCVAMSAGTIHPQEAWAWLRFLTTDPLQRGPGDVAGRIVVAEQRAYWWNDLADQAEATLRFALTHAWYGDLSSGAMPAIGEALNQAMRGEDDLASALASVDMTPLTPVPAGTADVSMAIATPIPTTAPTADAALPDNVVTVDYYADFTLHTSTDAVKSLAKMFNQTYPSIVINISDPRDLIPTGPDSIVIDNTFISQRFDCYARNTATARLYSDSVYMSGLRTSLTVFNVMIVQARLTTSLTLCGDGGPV